MVCFRDRKVGLIEGENALWGKNGKPSLPGRGVLEYTSKDARINLVMGTGSEWIKEGMANTL